MKKAIQKIIKDDQGRQKIIYIDPVTLKEIKDIKGYTVINPNSKIDAVQSIDTPNIPSTRMPADQGDRKDQYTSSSRLGEWKKGITGKDDRPISMPGDLSMDDQKKDARRWDAERTNSGEGIINPDLSLEKAAQDDKNKGHIRSTPDYANASVSKPNYDNRTATGKVTSPNSTSDTISPTQTAQTLGPDTNKAGFMPSFGPARPNMPSDEITDKVRMAVHEVLGPGYTVKGTSGTEGDLPQHGSNRHKTGKALDFEIDDPDGNAVTDPETRKSVGLAASELGVQGIGAGNEYMGASAMHFDTVDPSAYTPGQDSGWGSLGNQWQGDMDAMRNAPTSGPDTSFMTPKDRPMDTTGTPFDAMKKGMESVSQGIINDAKTPTGLDPVISQDISKASPATMAALGITASRTPAQRDLMTKVFAGELSPSALKGIVAGDPKALAQYHDMIATAENRSTTKKSFEDVFTGSQYNSIYEQEFKNYIGEL
jgi:hypothetical protein